ncbi:MAG: type II secretion system protein [Candidatus Omnitrophica bacterium]|nr:type II secretion system protein [Candidatus Omnitrophota bacterium]
MNSLNRLMNYRKTQKQGFTLIEMLVVIGVILILVGIAVPNFLNAVKRAKFAQGQTQIMTYEAAVAEYMTDTRKKIPSGSQNVYYALSGLAPFNAKKSRRYNPPYRDFDTGEIGRHTPGSGDDWTGYTENQIDVKAYGSTSTSPVDQSSMNLDIGKDDLQIPGVNYEPIIDPWGRPVLYISPTDLRKVFNKEASPWRQFIAISDETAFNDYGEWNNVPYGLETGQFWSAGPDGITCAEDDTNFGMTQPGNLDWADSYDNDYDNLVDASDWEGDQRSGNDTTFAEDDINNW